MSRERPTFDLEWKMWAIFEISDPKNPYFDTWFSFSSQISCLFWNQIRSVGPNVSKIQYEIRNQWPKKPLLWYVLSYLSLQDSKIGGITLPFRGEKILSSHIPRVDPILRSEKQIGLSFSTLYKYWMMSTQDLTFVHLRVSQPNMFPISVFIQQFFPLFSFPTRHRNEWHARRRPCLYLFYK